MKSVTFFKYYLYISAGIQVFAYLPKPKTTIDFMQPKQFLSGFFQRRLSSQSKRYRFIPSFWLRFLTPFYIMVSGQRTRLSEKILQLVYNLKAS
jgi:hypothetical protein